MRGTDDAYSIQSTCPCYWLDYFLTLTIEFMNFVEIFSVSPDLSSTYLLVLVGVEIRLCVVLSPSFCFLLLLYMFSIC